MRLRDTVKHWNTTEVERSAVYPCEHFAAPTYERYLRAVDVEADPSITFRWICQLTVAPYSYDWLDNWGRRSPSVLTPGAEVLDVGQQFLIARIVEFEPGRQITGVSTPRASRLFGPITLTYQVSAAGGQGSRIVACMTVGADSWAGRARRTLLGLGDLVMMRKQLLTLKFNAEASAASGVTL